VFINSFPPTPKKKVNEEADLKKLMMFPLSETMGITQNILASLTSGGGNTSTVSGGYYWLYEYYPYAQDSPTTDPTIPFKLCTRRFPTKINFAITFNKV
jgi:hypothetical protein